MHGLILPEHGDGAGIRGIVIWELFDEDGVLKAHGEEHNLITQIGDQYYGERATGVGSPPSQSTGMKLGTGSTAAAKTGAGAALVTYLTGSNQAFASGPVSSLATASRRITWTATWAAGTATASGIQEVVLVNDSAVDATSTAANTYSRAVLSPVINKGATDSLTITWQHDLLGA